MASGLHLRAVAKTDAQLASGLPRVRLAFRTVPGDVGTERRGYARTRAQRDITLKVTRATRRPAAKKRRRAISDEAGARQPPVPSFSLGELEFYPAARCIIDERNRNERAPSALHNNQARFLSLALHRSLASSMALPLTRSFGESERETRVNASEWHLAAKCATHPTPIVSARSACCAYLVIVHLASE